MDRTLFTGFLRLLWAGLDGVECRQPHRTVSSSRTFVCALFHFFCSILVRIQVGPDGQDLEKVVGEAVRAAFRGMRYALNVPKVHAVQNVSALMNLLCFPEDRILVSLWATICGHIAFSLEVII